MKGLQADPRQQSLTHSSFPNVTFRKRGYRSLQTGPRVAPLKGCGTRAVSSVSRSFEILADSGPLPPRSEFAINGLNVSSPGDRQGIETKDSEDRDVSPPDK